MKTSPSLDDALREFIESLADDFLAAKESGHGEPAAASVDEFVSSVEERFRSTLRERLAELTTRRPNELEATAELTPQRLQSEKAVVPATIELPPSDGAVANKKTAGDHLDPTHDTMAVSADAAQRTVVRSGDTPPEYQILGLLGKGGMGIVYEAEQVSLNRRVAVKVLPLAALLSKSQLARFKNEGIKGVRTLCLASG